MLAAGEHERVLMERDVWESIARERHATLTKLQEDRSHETIVTAGRLARLAGILMIVMVAFAGVLILSAAIRSPSCPAPAERGP